jgi:PadR family transcriptional regulator, regulatory protein PadR
MQHAAISRPKPLIVAHLLLLMAEQPRHGYELAASLRTLQFDGVTPSSVYRDLSRLEADGMVRSFWEASQARGPARHMYELTDDGRENLAACAADVRCLIAHLTDVLGQIESYGEPPAGDEAPVRARRRFWKGP